MTKDEKCKKLAEWLEPLSSLPNEDDSEEMRAYESQVWIASFRLSRVTGMHVPSWEPPDFYLSEEANALLLEKIPFVVVRRSNLPHGSGLERWYVGIQAQPKANIPAWWAEASDRKTAIAEAALSLIAKGEKEGSE